MAGALRRRVQQIVADVPWIWRCNDLPLYLVGGSWRALARAHLYRTGFPLPVLSNHSMVPEMARPFAEELRAIDPTELAAIPAMPGSRVAAIPDAGALLAALVEAVAPSQVVISPFGLREGMLYRALDAGERAKDPLIEGVRFVTGAYNQFPGLGEALADWSSGIFADELPRMVRLRRAVCHMVGTGWASNPGSRALRGGEWPLTGTGLGVDEAERASWGRALFTGLGGGGEPPAILAHLADRDSLAQAKAWGLAIRLGQRLSGGAAAILSGSRLSIEGRQVRLSLPPGGLSLVDETLRRRLGRLANALGDLRGSKLEPEIGGHL